MSCIQYQILIINLIRISDTNTLSHKLCLRDISSAMAHGLNILCSYSIRGLHIRLCTLVSSWYRSDCNGLWRVGTDQTVTLYMLKETKVMLVKYVGEICMLVKTRYVGEKLSPTCSAQTKENIVFFFANIPLYQHTKIFHQHTFFHQHFSPTSLQSLKDIKV